MIELLKDYDWQEVFKYGYPDAAVPLDTEIPLTPFSAEDVDEIYNNIVGYNDGDDWVMYGKLKDGRYFVIRAGCDYTGWG